MQGLGFVGFAVATAVAQATNSAGKHPYQVIGIDLPDKGQDGKIARIKRGLPPVASSDESINNALKQAVERGNLTATDNHKAYQLADIIIIDINLDINKCDPDDPTQTDFSYDNYDKAIRTIADNMKQTCLIIVETTVPPGTTEKFVLPRLKEGLQKRSLPTDQFGLAYAPERVMPGGKYLNSITNIHRIYAGINEQSSKRTEAFLSTYINTHEFPLSKLHSPTAAEMAKTLENSYRAANIAFIQEWTEFAELAEVDLFSVIEAIRQRPTHRNIMMPGAGVGGYCLTKDALLGDWGARHHYNYPSHLSQSIQAIKINDHMPKHTCKVLDNIATNRKIGKSILLGISYLGEVGDTRNTPAATLYDHISQHYETPKLHDPYLTCWEEKQLDINNILTPELTSDINTVIAVTRHTLYQSWTAEDWMQHFPSLKILIDANHIVSDYTAQQLAQKDIYLYGIGKGHWKSYNSNTQET